MTQTTYTVKKTFLEGALKGTTIEEQTTVRFEIGKTYGGGWSGSRYRVAGCDLSPNQNIQPNQVSLESPSHQAAN